MQRVQEFLRSVEVRLRCPADRRPAIIEELRGHLADRVEALVQQGIAVWDAGYQAVREAGPAWLLALRLSAANGWKMAAHVLRELWAASLATLVLVVAARLMAVPGIHVRLSAGEYARIGLLCLVPLAGLAAFGFALGRTVRGWFWAAVPALVAVAAGVSLVHDLDYLGGTPWLAAGAAVLVSALLGQRRESPQLQWLAWASAGLIGVCIPGIGVIAFWTASDGSLPQAFLAFLRDVTAGADATQVVSLAAAPWLFWLGARVIERSGVRTPAVAD
jgi:hypothetical protein